MQDTRASDDAALRLACARTADELIALRPVAAALKDENATLNRLLTLERQLRTGTEDLRNLDAKEKQFLRDALSAADREILALKQANAVLKKNKWTIWKFSKAALLGGAAGLVPGAILLK